MRRRLSLECRYALAFALAGWVLNGASASAESPGRGWYVDCASGNDAADGHSPSSAWRSVEAVSDRVFHPGDSIYFRRGTVCTGLLAPKGSGAVGASIHLDAWGVGALPSIRAVAGQKAVLKLSNQEYWSIQHLDFAGGDPYGVFITGTQGILHGIHIGDVVVHDVTGKPRDKETGLLVIAAGTQQAHFDDVSIDGVTAYGTSQWAGIMVAGVRRGFPPETSRNTNIVIRNSIVHDVAGDGIVLFQVNKGLIENSAAWHTGMQDTQSIGTPNAIWTWMCRDCTVRGNEAFLSDSPGVDGGGFDIDYGNDNNVVEDNYGHDTQGYCVAVFGAGWVTANSVVRNNVCAANGLSPREARRQGAVFLATWNAGKIKGLEISGNRIFWNPPLAAAAIVNTAEFVGSGEFERNTVESFSPIIIRSNDSLAFDNNSYAYCGRGTTRWNYAGKTFSGFAAYRAASGQDAHSHEVHAKEHAFIGPAAAATTFPDFSLRDVTGKAVPSCLSTHRWCLLAFESDDDSQDPASRGEVALLESVHRQFPALELQFIVPDQGPPRRNGATNLRYDWNTGDVPVLLDPGVARKALAVSHLPATVLLDPSGNIAWRRDGLAPPAELGLTLRALVGSPQYAEMSPER